METAWVRRVLVVEDQPAMRVLLCDMLTHRGFQVTAAGDAAEATRLFADTDPDVLLTDIDLGSRPTGIELATILTGLAPHMAVVFLSSFPGAVAASGRPGPEGAVFVSKLDVTSPEVVLDAVEAALRSTIPPAPSSVRASPLDGLTRRQIEVLGLVARGWSNEQIARERGTTTRAVERTVSRIFTRLGLGPASGTNSRVRASGLYLAEFGPVA
ncbi:response regulator transcription factor [Microbacterium sp.]|uniref:response regulator transcription factor n=1 Tax=Microbacterium sp. TaxID=51671 RepID=UPI0037C616A4